jgi:hypothetical protein
MVAGIGGGDIAVKGSLFLAFGGGDRQQGEQKTTEDCNAVSIRSYNWTIEIHKRASSPSYQNNLDARVMKGVCLSVVTQHSAEPKACLSKLALVRSLSPAAHTRSAWPRNLDRTDGGGDVNRPLVADDFAAIRARMEELRLERKRADAAERDLRSDPPTRPGDRIDPVMISPRRLRTWTG